ncbi:NAD(P)-binding domain-containing protein [Nocardioides sp. 31GB23]|uniref:NAD(P)-binding domain-containing protein n=1 Tax=Nocardioides sp. 31GB23 TaxID=3156065 RepID=UPI0032AF6882
MIAVVGLGNLGLAFALRLKESAGETVGVDPDSLARAAFESKGGVTAPTLRSLEWDQVHTVFVLVRTVAQARDVVGEVESLSRVNTGDLRVFVVTTMDPKAAEQLRSDTDLRVLESPISGGSDGTLAGRLTVLLGGPVRPEDVTFLRSTVAGNVVVFAELGQASFAKLINNAVMAANAIVVADAIEVARCQGLDPAAFHTVLSVSSGGSRAAEKFRRLDAPLLEKDAYLLADAGADTPWPPLWTTLVDRAQGLTAHLARARTWLERAE